MRHARAQSLLAGAALAAASAALGHAQTTGAVLAFINVTVVDVRTGGLQRDVVVVVNGARIQAVGPRSRVSPPRGVTTIDGAGAYVIPGLWDMHVHLFNNGQNAGTDNHATYFPLFLANGVTGVRDMWTDLDDLRLVKRWRDETTTGRILAPRMLASSPILDGDPPVWANSQTVNSAAQARQIVDSLAAGGAEAIKVYTRLSRETYLAIAERANAHRLPFIGHPPRALTVAEVAEAGQKSIEHLQGIGEECSAAKEKLRGSSGAAAGPARRQLIMDTYDPGTCAETFRLFVRRQTWQVPTLVLHRGQIFDFDPPPTQDRGLQFVSRAERDAWSALRARATANVGAEVRDFRRRSFQAILRLIGDMHRAGVPILAGTDLGNPFVIAGFSLHEELSLFVEAGMSPLDALRTATLNPSRYMGATDTHGTVEPGKIADFVLLDGNPLVDIRHTQKVRAVVSNGRQLDRHAIDRLLAAAETAARK